MQHIANALEVLNDNTIDKIVELFRSWDVRGSRLEGGHRCPLAVWLKRLDNSYEYCVYQTDVVISNEEEYACIDLGPNLQEFIGKFDHGNYPELELP